MNSNGYREVHIECLPRARRLRRLRAALPNLRPNRKCDPNKVPPDTVCYEYPAGKEFEFEKAASEAGIAFEWGGGAAAQFQVYRIKSDQSLALVSAITTTETIKRMARLGDFFFGVPSDGSSNKLMVIDARKPDAPEQIANFSTGVVANGVCAQGHLVFVLGPNIKVLDVTYPAIPRVIGTL